MKISNMFKNSSFKQSKITSVLMLKATKRNQKNLARIRLGTVYIALLLFLAFDDHLQHNPVLIVLLIYALYATILFLITRINTWIMNHSYIAFLMDEILIFFTCYFSGGLASPYIPAFLLPVLVFAINPRILQLALIIFISILGLGILKITTGGNLRAFIYMGFFITISGFFVNYLVSKDYRALSRYAVCDGLTGLFTHKYFYDKLDLMVSQPEFFSLIMIDLDEFKRLNDQYGHVEGDRILKEIAETIQLNVRESDIVARYGGDEFAIILPKVGYQLCQTIMDRLRAAIIDLGYFDNVSMGAALFPEEANDVIELVSLADHRMYEEKKGNKKQGHEKAQSVVDLRF
ncbi:diguanylate cyclase [Syntrophomonas erecta subsp. sporosyntropha]